VGVVDDRLWHVNFFNLSVYLYSNYSSVSTPIFFCVVLSQVSVRLHLCLVFCAAYVGLHVGGLRAYWMGALTEETSLEAMLLRLQHHPLDSLYCVCSRSLGLTKFVQIVQLEDRFYVVLALWQAIFGQCLASLASWPKERLLALPIGLMVPVLLRQFFLL